MKSIILLITILISLQSLAQIKYDKAEFCTMNDSLSNVSKISDLNKPIVRINFLFPGISIEKSLFNYKHTGFLSYSFLPIYDFQDLYQGYRNLTFMHMINFEYRYYFNIDDRMKLGKSIEYYHANYFSFFLNDIIHKHPGWGLIYDNMTLNLLTTGISIGGNINFWNNFYFNYAFGLGVNFINGKYEPFFQYNTSESEAERKVNFPIAPNLKLKVGINI
jgi:hypothetical protein